MNIDLKVCGITSTSSIKIAAENKIGSLGFASDNLPGPNTCNDDTIKNLIQECDYYKIDSVLLTRHQSLKELIAQIDYTKPKTISCSYFFSKNDLLYLKSVFKKLKIGIALNAKKFDEKYLNSIKLLVDVFYYDLNIYTKNDIITYSLKDCLKQIQFIKKFNTPVYIGGGINNKNAKKVIEETSPNGLDISRSLKDENNNISLLKTNGVKTVELGVQSTNDAVLKSVGRPCEFQRVKSAVKIIRDNELKLGLQLMPGLPLDNELIFMESVNDVISLKPDFVRIYPTLVIKNTELFEMYNFGNYVPWSLDRMIELVKISLIAFQKADIPAIRVGLHADPSMLENFVAGPYHPSFKYLVDRLIARDKMFNLLNRLGEHPKSITFKVPSRQVSLFLGHKKDNILAIKEKFGIHNILLKQIDNQKDIELVG